MLQTVTFVIVSAEMAKDGVHRAVDLFALFLDANQARQDQDLLYSSGGRNIYNDELLFLSLLTEKETFVLLILS